MAYGDIENIRDLGYLPEEDLDALDAERTTRIPALFDAVSGWLDTLLRPRYGVPFPPENLALVPEIVDCVVAIVVYRLYVTRGFPSIPDGSEVVEEIKRSRERAEKWAYDLRDGIAQLNPALDKTPARFEAGHSIAQSLSPWEFKFGKSGCC